MPTLIERYLRKNTLSLFEDEGEDAQDEIAQSTGQPTNDVGVPQQKKPGQYPQELVDMGIFNDMSLSKASKNPDKLPKIKELMKSNPEIKQFIIGRMERVKKIANTMDANDKKKAEQDKIIQNKKNRNEEIKKKYGSEQNMKIYLEYQKYSNRGCILQIALSSGKKMMTPIKVVMSGKGIRKTMELVQEKEQAGETIKGSRIVEKSKKEVKRIDFWNEIEKLYEAIDRVEYAKDEKSWEKNYQ